MEAKAFSYKNQAISLMIKTPDVDGVVMFSCVIDLQSAQKLLEYLKTAIKEVENNGK